MLIERQERLTGRGGGKRVNTRIRHMSYKVAIMAIYSNITIQPCLSRGTCSRLVKYSVADVRTLSLLRHGDKLYHITQENNRRLIRSFPKRGSACMLQAVFFVANNLS